MPEWKGNCVITMHIVEINSPCKSEGVCFYRRLFVWLSVCLSVTTITKKIVDGFVPNFTIVREMWK